MPRKAIVERTNRVLEILREIYPDARCELNYSNPLELLVATILSAQCTDKRVNLVTKTLFQRCRTAEDYSTIAPDDLEDLVRSTGFYRSKAKNIRAMAGDLVTLHGGRVPAEMEPLRALAGVGRKTANVVLGNAFEKNEGIVVDTHVARVSRRLGLTKESDPVTIEAALVALVPQAHWTLFSHWLIFHGRRRCMARNPGCPACELRDLCPSASKAVKPGKAATRSQRS